jgi:FOG: GAF domain
MQHHADRRAQPFGKCPELIAQKAYSSQSYNARAKDIDQATALPAGDPEASLFDALNIHFKSAISVWDIAKGRGFTLRYANAAFLNLIGKTAGEVLGKNIDEVIPSGGQSLSRFEECMRLQREVDFIHDHNGFIIATRVFPHMEDGRILRLTGASMDITRFIHEWGIDQIYGGQAGRQNPLLCTQLKFESLIANSLREFMDSGNAGFDKCLSALNRGMGIVMGADQAYVFQRHTENRYVHKAYWSRDGRPQYACAGHSRGVRGNRSRLPHINRMLIINDVSGEHGAPCTQELKQLGIRALLAVPVCRDAHVYGLLCFTHLSGPRVWTTADISMAKTAADTIMCAYLRLLVEKGLNENMRILTEYDESLQDLLAQKETLADVSQNFLRAGVNHFSECAQAALEDIGCLLGADGIRVLFRAGDGGMEVFEWQEDGLPCRIGKEYGSLNAAALNAAETLRKPVAIDDTAQACPLPELARAGAEEGLRSLLTVPAYHPDGIAGVFICFKAIGLKQWQCTDIASAEAFTEIFLSAYRLKRSAQTGRSC